jgi:protein-S-isoprenylcysteine O-methyltransferase Ste14
MFHPAFCYLSVALTFLLTYLVFANPTAISNATGIYLNPDSHFYLPIALLISFYTLLSLLTDRQSYLPRSALLAYTKAVPKFLFFGTLLLAVYKLYDLHPFYHDFTPNTRRLLLHFLYAYLYAGLPYFFLEEKLRASTDNFLADPYLRFSALLLALARGNLSLFRRRLFNHRNRRTLLSSLLRFHYVPIMVEQVHYFINQVNWYNPLYNHSLPYLTFLLGTLAWLIDSNNASIGYFWQSTFTKTRFRDADPHPSHWILVLACYPPFIDFVTANFVQFPALAEDAPRLLSPDLLAGIINSTHLNTLFSTPLNPAALSIHLNTAIDLTILAALICYMLSGTALAFSYSNLAYKKIQTRGPYALVRHPATACKMLYFSLVFFRFAEALSPRWVVCWIIWMSVYVGRALVEERFLNRFPEYRTYTQKTRYRFFPGLA